MLERLWMTRKAKQTKKQSLKTNNYDEVSYFCKKNLKS